MKKTLQMLAIAMLSILFSLSLFNLSFPKTIESTSKPVTIANPMMVSQPITDTHFYTLSDGVMQLNLDVSLEWAANTDDPSYL